MKTCTLRFLLKRNCTGVAAALTSLILASCGGGGGSGGGPAPAAALPPGSATVGAAGGRVTSADGKVELTIPAGALGNSETIRIESVDPATLPAPLAGASLAYEMKPDGLRFAQPVSARISMNATRQSDGSLVVPLAGLATLTGAAPEPLADQAIAVNGDTAMISLTGTLTHFSPVVVQWQGFYVGGANFAAPGHMDIALLIPATAHANALSQVSVLARSSGFSGQSVPLDVSFSDRSSAPLRNVPRASVGAPDASGFVDVASAFPVNVAQATAATVDYTCDAVGPATLSVAWRLKPDIRVLYAPQAALPPFNVTYSGSVTCDPPAPPSPPRPSSPGAVVHRVPLSGLENFDIIVNSGVSPAAYGSGATLGVVALTSRSGGVYLGDLGSGGLLRGRTGLGPRYGGVAWLKDGLGCLFSYGPNTASFCYYPSANDFGATEVSVSGGPYGDAGRRSNTPTQSSRGSTHLKWWVGGGVVYYDDQPGGPGTDPVQLQLSASWYASGTATGVAQSAFFNATGNGAIVVRGTPGSPGQAWYGDPRSPTGGTLIGSLGAQSLDTRKIRCVVPGLCAASNFAGPVSLLFWDGVGAPTIVGTIPGTGGSVTPDIVVEGGNFAVRSTDYNANTVTKAFVGSGGQVISSVTKPLPAGCLNAGHVGSFVDAADNNKVKTVVSCSSSDTAGESAIVVLDDVHFF